jgi:molybdopterin synthase catalytic subunit
MALLLSSTGGITVSREVSYENRKALEEENENLLKQRNEALSLVGAIVAANGGEVRISDESLMVGYAFESHRDPLLRQTIVRAIQA